MLKIPRQPILLRIPSIPQAVHHFQKSPDLQCWHSAILGKINLLSAFLNVTCFLKLLLPLLLWQFLFLTLFKYGCFYCLLFKMNVSSCFNWYWCILIVNDVLYGFVDFVSCLESPRKRRDINKVLYLLIMGIKMEEYSRPVLNDAQHFNMGATSSTKKHLILTQTFLCSQD